MTTANQKPQVQGVDYEVTGVGRIVQGDLDTLSNLDFQTGKPRLNADGTEKKPENFYAIAFPKMINGQPNPDWARVQNYLTNIARRDWPTFFPNGATQCVNPNFHFKITDGDGYDKSGVHNATKEGFAGHWVLRFSSQFLPKRFYQGQTRADQEITQPGVIKRGDWVRVLFTAAGNGSTQSPGLFVRGSAVELFFEGKAIVSASSGPDASVGLSSGPAVNFVPEGATAVQAPANAMPVAPVAPGPAPAAPGVQPEPYLGYVPAPPVDAPAVPVAPAFPPEGWQQHPNNPAYWYKGTEVITEAELRARG